MYGSLYTLAEVSQQKVSSSLAFTNSKPASLTCSTLTHPANLAATSSTSGLASHSLDVSSVKRYAIMGTFVFPPLLTRWYSWLDGRFPCTSGAVVSKKLLLDQFIFTPWVVVIFYVGMAWLEGKQGPERWLELQQKGVTTFLLDCIFWLPVQVTIKFSFHTFILVSEGFFVIFHVAVYELHVCTSLAESWLHRRHDLPLVERARLCQGHQSGTP